MFNNLKIGTRLAIGFALILGLLALLTLFGINRMGFLAEDVAMIYNHPLAVSNAALMINTDIYKIHRDMKDVVLAGDEVEIERLAADVDGHEACVLRSFKTISERFLGERGKYDAALGLFTAWRPIRDEVFALMLAGRRAEAVEITRGKGARHVLKIEEAMEPIGDFAQYQAADLLEIAGNTKDDTLLMMYTLLVFTVLGGMAFATLLTESITRPVEALKNAAREIGRGSLDTDIPVGSADEIGELARSFEEMAGNLDRITASRNDLDIEMTERRRAEAALKESEEKYRELFENETDAVMVFDAETHRFEEANRATLELFGYTREEFLTLTPLDISFEQEKTKVAMQGLIDGVPDSGKVPLRYLKKKDGTVFPGDISSGAFYSKGRKKFIGAVRDITERKRMEEELRVAYDSLEVKVGERTSELAEANEELRAKKEYLEKLHYSLGDAVFSVRMPERTIEFANKAVEDILGFTPEECIGRQTNIFYPTEQGYADYGSMLMGAMGRGAEVVRSELLLKRKNGELCSADVTTTFVREDGEVKNVISIIRDVTERKRAEEELREAHTELEVKVQERTVELAKANKDLRLEVVEHEQAEESLIRSSAELGNLNKELHDLALEVKNVEDRERKRFAGMLHEDIGQNLVAIKLAYDSCMLSCSDTDARKDSCMREVRPLLNDTIKATRDMISDIYPAPLKEVGLADAVRWYVDTILSSSGVTVSMDIDSSVKTLPQETQRVLFSIIRESFQNIMKYASATEVMVMCRRVDDSMPLMVYDNGVGFDAEEVRAKERPGIGQSLMREWVMSIDGKLSIQSAPGNGTEVYVEFPVEVWPQEKRHRRPEPRRICV